MTSFFHSILLDQLICTVLFYGPYCSGIDFITKLISTYEKNFAFFSLVTEVLYSSPG